MNMPSVSTAAMATLSERCQKAYTSHHNGCNCAQSMLIAFSDRLHLTPEQAMTIAGGFGGGIGGSHQELCGAISGGVLVLGMLFPHQPDSSSDKKRVLNSLVKEFRIRFIALFGKTCCKDLLAARPPLDERMGQATLLGITSHCDLMIVSATEIIEALLNEQI